MICIAQGGSVAHLHRLLAIESGSQVQEEQRLLDVKKIQCLVIKAILLNHALIEKVSSSLSPSSILHDLCVSLCVMG
jgi:hypothetical protein